ncbi:MAG TPA: HAD family hydrolase [Gemmatimonadaceae bacterium]|nr:HAD family hydrolase [Gemmatimonadaceae bacterium]
MPPYDRLKAVLLDVDGTLLDSNDAHARSWVDTLTESGYNVKFERVRQLIGMGGDNLLPELIHVGSDSDEGKALGERRAKIFKKQYLPALRPTRGARALLERMRADGLTLVVATSAQGDELHGLLVAAGIADLVDETTSASDARKSKPNPDIVAAALERGGVEPREAMMLGDTPYDVTASRRAGVRIVGVRCGGWSDADLSGATAVYEDPADLLARYELSPFTRASSGG